MSMLLAGLGLQAAGGLFNYFGSRRTAGRIEKRGREAAGKFDPFINRSNREYDTAMGRNSLLQATRMNQAMGSPGMGEMMSNSAMMGRRSAGARAGVQMASQNRANANRLSSMEEQFSMRNFQQAQTAAQRGEGLLNAQQSLLMNAMSQGANYRAQGISGLANTAAAMGGQLYGSSQQAGRSGQPSHQGSMQAIGNDFQTSTAGFDPASQWAAANPAASLMPNMRTEDGFRTTRILPSWDQNYGPPMSGYTGG